MLAGVKILEEQELIDFLNSLSSRLGFDGLSARPQHYGFADRRLLGPDHEEETLDRQQQLSEALHFIFGEPRTKQQEKPTPAGRETRAILAAWAPPGAGKSHMIDFIARRVEEMQGEQVDARCKCVTITFNCEQDLTQERGLNQPVVSLCARLIFSAFNFGDNWSMFVTNFFSDDRHRGLRSASAVIHALRRVADFTGPRDLIFVGVDELIKYSGDAQQLRTLYEAVVSLTNSDPRCRLFITTLDSEPIRTDIFGERRESGVGGRPVKTKGSGRIVQWLLLEPITSKTVKRCVIANWQTRCSEWVRPPLLQWLAARCGGHARSLAEMGESLALCRIDEQKYKQCHSARSIFHRAQEKLWSYNPPGASIDDILIILACSLMNQAVRADSKLNDWSVEDLIASGWMLNPAQQSSGGFAFVPILSLLLSSKRFQQHPESRVCTVASEVLLYGEKGTWSAFQHFHARMEVLKRWAALFLDPFRKFVQLHEWYQGAIIVAAANATNEVSLVSSVR